MRFDPLYTQHVYTSLDALSQRDNTLSAELSSGLRVAHGSDDPVAAASAVRDSAALARDDAFSRAATTVEGRMQVADSTLSSVVTQINSAISLAVQGSNGTMSAANVQAIGQQLGGLRDEVLQLANTSYSGTYLFSGTQQTAAPFSVDASGNIAYAGDDGSSHIVTANGQTIASSVPGSALFHAPGASVLDSLSRLAADFSSGTASGTAASDLQELRAGLTQLSTVRATLDGSLAVLTSAATFASTDSANLQAAQGTLVSADTAQVASELSSTETQQQALMSVMASTSKTNLFDLLQ